MGATDLFGDYERECEERLSRTQRELSASSSRADSRALDAIDRDLVETNELLESMSLEAASLHGNARSRATMRVEVLRADASSARASLRAARIELAARKGEEDRMSLFSGSTERANHDLEAGHGGKGSRYADTTRKLQDSSERILESRRNLAQTESIGASILEDLQGQRNTIERARDRLGGVETNLDQSDSILSAMNRRALINKIVINGLFAFICLFCAWIVYVRVFHAKDKSA